MPYMLCFSYMKLLFRYIYQEEELQQACNDLQHNGNPQSAWDLLAPATEDAEEAAHEEGPSNEREMDPEDIQANIESIVRPTEASEGKLSQKSCMPSLLLCAFK